MSCGPIGMYWVKCKQSKSHTSLTTLSSHFLLSYGNQAMTKSAHKSSFFPYKQLSGRNGDHEWLRMTKAFILCDLLWKVQKSRAANREGSFNLLHATGTRMAEYYHYCNHMCSLCVCVYVCVCVCVCVCVWVCVCLCIVSHFDACYNYLILWLTLFGKDTEIWAVP